MGNIHVFDISRIIPSNAELCVCLLQTTKREQSCTNSGDTEPEPKRTAEARAPTVQLLGAPCVCNTILQFSVHLQLGRLQF